ncbi:MAG: phosphoadenosine phosphosulfate reductase family protein [Cycloclasticus sp.]
MIDINKAKQMLSDPAPLKIIEWVVAQARKPITTTNFGPHEAVILHMVTQVKADMPIIWIDSGYNTKDTYNVAEQLIDLLALNIEVYTPKVSAARRDSVLGGIPHHEDEKHAEFTEQFKLEPFSRAMHEQEPDIWLTAVRREQTAVRQAMEVFTREPNGLIKVAPLLHWKEADMQRYLEQFDLPNVSKYFDPTKALKNRECGLHTPLIR